MISIPLLALINAARGNGDCPRWLFFPLVAFVAYTASFDWKLTAFYTVAIACWLVPAWAKGLSIVRDNQDYEGLFKYWAVRSAYILPAFLAMAWYYHSLMILAIGFLIQLQGLIYFVSGRLVTERHAVRVAEYLMGVLLGVMLLLTVENVQTNLFDSLYYGQPVIADELLRLNGAL